MKIMLVGKYPPIQGGTSRATYWSAHDLVESGHEVEVISNNFEVEPTFRQFLDQDDIRHLTETTSKGKITLKSTCLENVLYIPQANPYLSKLIGLTLESAQSFKPDIIVGWYLEPYGVAAAIASSFYNIPLILMHAGSDVDHLAKHPNLKETYKEIIKKSQYVLTSPFAELRSEVLKDLGLKEEQTLHLGTCAIEQPFVTNKIGINVNEFLENCSSFFDEMSFDKKLILAVKTLNKKPFATTSYPVVGIYGKVGGSKGSFTLLKALEILAQKKIEFRFLTMSSGWPHLLQRYYEIITQSKELYARTWILPPLAPWRVPNFLQTCDMIFFLENNFSVKFHNPRVPREVLAAGKCLVLSTDKIENLGFGDGLIDGENVILIEDPNNPEALAEKLSTYLLNKERLKAIAWHGKGLSKVVESHLPSLPAIVRLANDWANYKNKKPVELEGAKKKAKR